MTESTNSGVSAHLKDARPFGDGALIYFAKGWTDVFPIGTRSDRFAKSPVPVGVTGYDAPPVGFDRIKLGTQQSGSASRNIGIRMPRQVICLDVDQYEDHDGFATLRAAEAELGKLPATYRSTARPGDISGHRFFRVPIGNLVIPGAEEILRKAYGPNIEILHRGRRYAVAWPSRNPHSGYAMYRWYDPDGAAMESPPAVVSLPVLPDRWAALLTAPEGSAAVTRSGGNLRAPRSEKPAEADDDLFDEVRKPIRRSVAEARTTEQVGRIVRMKVGEINKTLGGAGIWLARMASSGLFELAEARELLVTATYRNGKHSDAWNRANKRGWTLDSRIDDAMSQGLNRDPYQIIDDHEATDFYGQLKARLAR